MNILRDNMDFLSKVNYIPVLTKLLNSAIDKLQIKQTSTNLKISNLSDICESIANHFKRSSALNTLEIDMYKAPDFATLEHKDYATFAEYIKMISEKLNCPEIDSNLLTDIYSLKSRPNEKINFGMDYNFNSHTVNKRRISFNPNQPNQMERLRMDYVEIEINTENDAKFLVDSVIELIKEELDEDDQDIQITKALNLQGGLEGLIDMLENKSLACISRSISIMYMYYLLLNYKNKNSRDYILTKCYITRFSLVEQYLAKLSFKREQDKTIVIGTFEKNISNIFSQSNIFDMMPFIGKVDGILSKDKTDKTQTFKRVLSMKLNGNVQAEDQKASYRYHLDSLEEDLRESKFDKAIRKIFLFSFLLFELENPNYDPVLTWERDDDLGLKRLLELKRFDQIIKVFDHYFNANGTGSGDRNIQSIENIFLSVVRYRLTDMAIQDKDFDRELFLFKNVLAPNLDSHSFLRPVKHFTEYLQNISVIHEKNLDQLTINENVAQILLKLPIKINIKSKAMYETSDIDQLTIDYNKLSLNILPIIFYPSQTNYEDRNSLTIIEKNLQGYFNIKIPYTINPKMVNDRIYQISYLTLLNTILCKCLPKTERNKLIYINLMRIHRNIFPEEVGSHVRNVVKIFEHGLNNEYHAASQGFNIDNSGDFVYNNALSSMYANVPKNFIFDTTSILDQTAIIIVTSRQTDSSFADRERGTKVLLGEVVLLTKISDNCIIYDTFKTFQDYYDGTDVFYKPDIVTKTIDELYDLGYKDIIYIAQKPFTSKVNLTKKVENMFFMNEDVLEKVFKLHSDLRMYPLYFEQFRVIDHSSGFLETALHMKDTQEIDQHIKNENKKLSGVFNIYSGQIVGGRSEKGKIYRKVMSYSTITNIYKNEDINNIILKGLVENGALKDSLVTALMLHHYAKYEKQSKKTTIKINPYSRLLGDDGVAARSIFSFENGPRFNGLAYVTDMNKILDVIKESEE
ncbi:MAG: hypothetical protein ATN31_01010 [Candidatus Epulonipiscioides saccharophilum]|nr:MAG: hypothetical protein ATN31_01010 [Epulopiscium sp. AS2M-Bin001]